MRIGAHVSTRGHIWEAIGRAKDIGAECMQVFVSYPQRWLVPALPEDDAQEFRRLATLEDVAPVYLHAIYLINFGSEDPDLFEKSIQALANYLKVAAQLNAAGVIAHMGSALSRPLPEAEESVAVGLEAALRKADNGVPILIENNAGSGNCLGSTFAQIGRFIDMCHGDERLQVCIDTAHTFASGYDYPNGQCRQQMFDDIQHSCGFSRVRALHVNDSKARFGSGVDRHENLGDGYIGLQGLQDILLPLAANGCDFMLEVPGYEGHGPDKRSIETLRKLVSGEPVELEQPALFGS
jgi:deoxyribonuclease-4